MYTYKRDKSTNQKKKEKIIMEKITKRNYFNAISNAIASMDSVDGIAVADVQAFIDARIAELDKKAESAKKSAAKKRAAGDELRAQVEATLTDELQTIDAITSQIEGEEITRAKVQARLSQLVKAGIAVKDDVEDGKRKVKGYRLAAVDEIEAEE